MLTTIHKFNTIIKNIEKIRTRIFKNSNFIRKLSKLRKSNEISDDFILSIP